MIIGLEFRENQFLNTIMHSCKFATYVAKKQQLLIRKSFAYYSATSVIQDLIGISLQCFDKSKIFFVLKGLGNDMCAKCQEFRTRNYKK